MENAPRCEWKHFRDWVLQLIACLMNASDQNYERDNVSDPVLKKGKASNQTLKEELWNWGRVIYEFSSVAKYTDRGKITASIDLFEIYELINWMLSINSFLISAYDSHSPLRTHISRHDIVEATQTARKVGICQNRLWNLTIGSGRREEADLPILMTMLSKSQYSSNFKHREHKVLRGSIQDMPLVRDQEVDHHDCTAEICNFSSIDSTRVRQLHKCLLVQDCGEALSFPSSEFQNPYERFTWWLDDTKDIADKSCVPYVKQECQGGYLAISHVWSDGTGAGVQGEGRVNRCLFDYFRGIAKKLGCTAIWWDTISIPMEREARKIAISRMNENYKQAGHVVIHDQYLVQFPWAEDGSPCLALLLSPWFTRAWTALELVMSKKGSVSVIYKDSKDPCGYTIKNLEREILAQHPAYASRGHWICSSQINQLRGQKISHIEDIQNILMTKSTSRPPDLIVIANLLAGRETKRDITKPGAIAGITRDIILDAGEIEESFLHHGHTTMTEKGGFSWCPFSLLDGRIRTNTDRPEKLFVDEKGAASGFWEYRLLSQEDTTKIRPHSLHPSVEWRIRSALEQWENCLLLKNAHQSLMDTVLLVTPLGVGAFVFRGTESVILDCQYIGAVFIKLEWGLSYLVPVRLGNSDMDPDFSAAEVIDKYDQTKGFRPYELISGRNLRNGGLFPQKGS